MTSTGQKRACIIGAGASGISAAKALQDINISFDCFEISDQIGGNWYYQNPNGLSACYSSLHIDTSKYRMAFKDFPIPKDFPDYPHHSQVLNYMNDYVDHFNFRGKITFNTRVELASLQENNQWKILRTNLEDDSSTESFYDYLFVCNGHHWSPRWPDPPFPGEFDGIQMHSHQYQDPFNPYEMRGKNILIVGMGNSAMDIASELSQKPIAKKLWVAARRGVYILPKYHRGKPLDKIVIPGWIPISIRKKIGAIAIKNIIGKMEDYGLPKPDHEPLEAHPTVSGEFLTRCGSGDISIKSNIREFSGKKIIFEDGSTEEVDIIIYATGYQVSFPFLSDEIAPVTNNHLPLFKRMIRPEIQNLFFIGLAQSIPTLINFPEQQLKLIQALLTGDYKLPSKHEMEAIILEDEKENIAHFYKSARHTMQVDFDTYRYDLRKEIRRGKIRARKPLS